MFAATKLKTENRVQEGGGADRSWAPRIDLIEKPYWEYLKKKFFVNIKAKYFLLATKMCGIDTEWWRQRKARRRFPGTWKAYQEALEVISRGSWRSCASSLGSVKMDCNLLK